MKKRSLKQRIVAATLALVMLLSSLLGTTFAWFTDSVTSGGNKIQSGNLEIDLLHKVNSGWVSLKEHTDHKVFDYDKWEPGYTRVESLKVANLGSLALKYKLSLEAAVGTATVGKNGEKLSDVIDVYILGEDSNGTSFETIKNSWVYKGTLTQVLKNPANFFSGELLPTGEDSSTVAVGNKIVSIALHMQEEAGNEYQKLSVGDIYVNLIATQSSYENDSFDDKYDEDAIFPELNVGGLSIPVNTANGATTEQTESSGKGVSATIPKGVAIEDGVDKLVLSVSEKEQSDANLTLNDGEALRSLDVHMTGVSENNTVPMLITVEKAMKVGLNIGNYKLFHVEGGVSNQMTAVNSLSELDAHNEFYYDPVTGDVTLAMATFSEVALVAEQPKWEGNRDYTWYNETDTEFTIANADQLAAFGAIVGGMAKDENGNFLITYTDSDGDEHHNDSFEGKTVKLLADINLGDAEAENDPDLIFYPIGYWNSEGIYEKTGTAISSGFYAFEGTFDGNGNTISNFYQNTWEMKGDHDWYDATLQYYRDGMGLFGKVYGGTVKNLTVDNFSCDSEIGTSGVIAAYADSKAGQHATFENITITNCNPRVYNIGNGGIVGCAGWYSRNDSLITGTEENPTYDNAVTFRNITVDQTNKISALWGSWGVSCAGILGQYYPNSSCGIKLENCHVAAIIDVNNDVCSNYQYYWYRYAGMFIGTIRANTTDANGYTVADTTGVTATDCTYTMGNWNEYWYCEIVANSLASYTHDHQFSRLENIYNISEISDDNGVTWKKEGHFALLDENRDIVDCYHIFKNSNGELYQHFHDKADESNPNIYESFDLNGDGELNDLKEDRQRYFIPFNQLLTGLDMGIKAHTEFEGIEFVEDGTVKSVPKFESLGTVTTYRPGQTITLGQLVDSIVDDTKLSKASIYAAVSPATEKDNVSATYSLNLDNWKNSTIEFAEGSTGSAKIVITDYFYCTATVIYLNPEQAAEKFTANSLSEQNAYTQITLGTIFGVKDGATIGNVTATVTDPNGTETTLTGASSDWAEKTIDLTKDGTWTVAIEDDDAYCAVTTVTFTVNTADKFVKTFKDASFTYRIGNESTVAFSSLFTDLSPAIGAVNRKVTFTEVAGDASATMTDDTIQFTGNGKVIVTVTADGANDATVTLEVVDAVNVTGATNATANNVVLLNDAGFSSLEVSGGYTLYGNGFTLTCGSDSAALDTGYAFVTLNNGTLDNVQIICPNFDYAVLYSSNMKESGNRSETTDKTRYFNVKSGVMVSGNSQILNSRISGARAAVNVSGGNCVIDNSRLEGGAVASLLVGAANSVTLRDVTLVQKPTASTYDSSKMLMGFSVLMICNSDGDAAPLTLEGTLIQNAWVDETDSQYVPSAGQSIISSVLSNEAYTHDLDGDGTRESLNLGFAYMPESLSSTVNTTTITDNRTNKNSIPYDYAEVAILNGNTYVYSYKYAENESIPTEYKNTSAYVSNKYSDIINVTYSDTTNGLTTGKSYGTDGWIYELNVDLDTASGYALDFSKLSMTVNGVTVSDYLVDGSAKPTSPITVVAGGITYALTATVNGIEYTATYKVTGTETSKESPSLVGTPSYGVGFGVANNYGGDWSAAAPVLDGITIKYWSVADSEYKEFALSSITFANTGKQNGTNNYWEYTHTNNDFTLKLTNTAVIHSGSGTYGMPVAGKDGKLYFTISSSSGFVSTGTTSRSITIAYEFTDNNGGDTLKFSHTWSITYSKDEQYNYSSFTNDGTLTLLEASSSSTCITPDTLITLADGTQVRVDSLTGDEMLLVWNMETGKLDKAPIMFVDNEAEAEYEIVHLYFSDGTDVKVIYEHGFWDYDLNKYVYLDRYAEKYIGHTFAKQNGDKFERVQLVDVVIETEVTTAWSPVTEGHLCYFVNGMLSMPGGVGGLFNIFEVDPETMTYDYEAMQKDIETYGLYTYEELNAICPLSEEMFNAAGGAYLKISIGKGNLTEAELIAMINRYSKFF